MIWILTIVFGIASFMLARYVIRPRFEARKRARLLPRRFVVVDIQTTGPGLDKHEIVGVAAVGVTPGSEQHQFIRGLIKPTRPIPRKVAESTGITEELLAAEGKPEADVLAAFVEFARGDRLVFFGGRNELAFLRALAARHDTSIDNPISDAQDMARRAWPSWTSHKLKDLARSLNVELPQRNHPAHDCGLVAVVYTEAALKLKQIQ